MSEKTFSFEFFPPKNDKGEQTLRKTWEKLATLKPEYFSVTYGAGGSTQERTLGTVLQIQKESGIEAAPHLSCVGSSKEQIRNILNLYRDNGIKHIVALRGDLPSGSCDLGDFQYANELVTFIREETGDHFSLEVAAYPEMHPQAKSFQHDLENFVRKVNAGSNRAITQYFYNADAYFRFVDSCTAMGVDIPIIPGIMPITNYTQLARFSNACGAEIPRWLRVRLEAFGDDTASIKALGKDFITEMCQTLMEGGAPGIHFYSMNRTEPSMSIYQSLSDWH